MLHRTYYGDPVSRSRSGTPAARPGKFPLPSLAGSPDHNCLHIKSLHKREPGPLSRRTRDAKIESGSGVKKLDRLSSSSQPLLSAEKAFVDLLMSSAILRTAAPRSQASPTRRPLSTA
ncbi:hypothetical protein GQ602_005737 [Ophiocordyceps camponoti-floridani]|uniref:Uncharacterized protein n=1 Tax=Ophiocordyceps camponoti-floridani TaxID=2030778 RepID=A0A8H4VC34_9HYPO|nr:hypothetical protein GQ602_005737 [Ophiocordyceps camponoti-floridani]